MIFSEIAGDISEIAGDVAISEQSVKKIIIPYNTSLRELYRLCHDEVRIRIFDDPAEQEIATSGHGQIRSWSHQTRARARRARTRCVIFFLEKLRKPARTHRAGTIRQFPTSQLDSSRSIRMDLWNLLDLQLY